MGVSTAFVLKSGCTQRERRGGKVEETNQGNNPRQQRQFKNKRKLKTSFQLWNVILFHAGLEKNQAGELFPNFFLGLPSKEVTKALSWQEAHVMSNGYL